MRISHHVTRALADASNVGERLRLEHPLGHADEIRAVRQTLSKPEEVLNARARKQPQRQLPRRKKEKENKHMASFTL